MYGFCLENKYNQNASNYSNGHTWYVNSNINYNILGSCLYGIKNLNIGTNFYNNSTSFPSGELTSGTIYGCVYNKKKGEIYFYKNGK
jgi:hypothetical protein